MSTAGGGAFMTDEQKLEMQLTGMTPKQRAAFTSKRSQYFKGTIAVCVIYGTLALIMFILSLSSERGRELLATDLLPFTVTFIGGMIFVIVVLTIQVLKFKPPVYDTSDPNAMLCPDYWTLKKTPAHILENAAAEDRYKLQYMCVNERGNLLNQNSLSKAIIADFTDKPVSVKLRDDVAKKSYGATGNINCNQLYPELMSVADRAAYPEAPNRLRCQYARSCGIAWTATCPEVPSADA